MAARMLLIMIGICTALLAYSQKKSTLPVNKQAILKSIEKQQDQLIKLSDLIWELAETAMKETQSSLLLADYAESHGFKVTKGVAQIPTAFVAEYGSGKPIIGIMGEFDALPGLSQKATAIPEELKA